MDFVVEQLQEEEELGEPTDPVQEHEGEVEEPLPGVGEQFEGGAGTMSDPMDEDPRPPDQRTPPPTPSPQVVGEPNEAALAEAELVMVDMGFHATYL